MNECSCEYEAKYKLYYNIINSISEAIIVSNFDGVITDCNTSTTRIFGWPLEELMGQKIEILVPSQFREMHKTAIENYRKTGKSRLFGQILEIDGLHRNGNMIPINLCIMSTIFENTVMFLAVIRDATQKRLQEKQINILIETLETRVNALERFQFSIAHDLNAPLRAIQGFTEILVEDYGPVLEASARDCISRIDGAVKRMQNLITDMLRLSRVSKSTEIVREHVNLSELVNEILNNYKMIDHKRNVIVKVQPDIYDFVDKEFITILLDNLLSNAWKFTSKKEIAEIEFGRKIIGVDVVYFIKDNGAGFDMTLKDKLFKPFSRLHTKQEFDGNGVGLSIVKQVVVLHGGNVWAEGEVGIGATFYFTVEDNLNVKSS